MVDYYCTHCGTTSKGWGTTPTVPCSKCRKPAAKGSAPQQSAVVPAKASGPAKADKTQPIDQLGNELLSRIFRLLDERSLGFVAMVCQRWKPLGAELLSRFVPHLEAYGSGTSTLKTQVMKYVAGAKNIQLAVDQFPFPGKTAYRDSILNYIITHRIGLSLALGTKDDRTMRALVQAGKKVQHVSTFHKMHNKLWVIDHDGVILGSPNVSFSGLEGGNLESCIYIHSPRLGSLFGQYLELIKQPDPSKSLLWKKVADGLDVYNREAHQVKVALAPVMNITDFVVEQLAGSTKIVIRQFLISPKKGAGPGQDMVDVLCKLARRRVEIEVYLDEGAYNAPQTSYFVETAAKRLVRAGCKVYTQKPVVVVNVANEGIQHDKLILATLHRGVQRTLIGSAGFTKDVIANKNAENFICTDVGSVYDDLMAHHLRTLDGSVAVTKQLLLDKGTFSFTTL